MSTSLIGLLFFLNFLCFISFLVFQNLQTSSLSFKMLEALPLNLCRARYAHEQNGDVQATADRFSSGHKDLSFPDTDGGLSVRSLIDVPMHVATEHVVGFLDVIGLIRLSATCRKWYAVRRSILQLKLSAEQSQCAASPIEYAGSVDFSPHRAHRYRTLAERVPPSPRRGHRGALR